MPDYGEKKEGKKKINDNLFKNCAWSGCGGLFPVNPAFYEEKDAFPEIYAALVVFRDCDGDFGSISGTS